MLDLIAVVGLLAVWWSKDARRTVAGWFRELSDYMESTLEQPVREQPSQVPSTEADSTASLLPRGREMTRDAARKEHRKSLPGRFPR
mmetsp:Transcript_10693/g.21514  ORF Transcript_10693/g.21514 Transcript_10693/m.21514 type:complete len:87 (-) Transcript_10693:286-546(-)